MQGLVDVNILLIYERIFRLYLSFLLFFKLLLSRRFLGTLIRCLWDYLILNEIVYAKEYALKSKRLRIWVMVLFL